MSGDLPVEVEPPRAEPPETPPEDPRLGHWLAEDGPSLSAARAVLLGFPSDEGVRRNGGRPGASDGPSALRRALYGLTPDPRDGVHGRMTALLERTRDAGDVAVTGDVEEDQSRLADAVAQMLEHGAVPVILGGGHETAFGHFLAYVRAGIDVEIVNWDAHPDVRPWEEGGAHSGSPFRQALEHPSGRCRGYSAVGLRPDSVSRAHLEYLGERAASVTWREETDASAARAPVMGRGGPILASFDLDAVDRAHAPGVSAPATDGLPPGVWLTAAEAAGRSPAVASVDVVELNPRFDPDGRTASLAAATVWRFLRGLAVGGPRDDRARA